MHRLNPGNSSKIVFSLRCSTLAEASSTTRSHVKPQLLDASDIRTSTSYYFTIQPPSS